MYEFTLDSATLGSGGLTDDVRYNLELMSDNEMNRRLNLTPVSEGTNALGFTLQNGSNPYIYELNYLQAYNGTNYESITGGPLDKSNIFAMPFAVEILIGNPGSYGPLDEPVEIPRIRDVAGNTYTTSSTSKYNYKRVNTNASDVTTVTRMVNGATKTFYRLVYEFDEMPVTGTQTIEFKMLTGSAAVKPATINLLYGPYANYDKAVDGMIINVDTTMAPATQAANVITTMLGDFAGSFKNIANENSIRYTPSGSETQTVFFYINNTLVPLKQNGTKKSEFILDTGAMSVADLIRCSIPAKTKSEFCTRRLRNTTIKRLKLISFRRIYRLFLLRVHRAYSRIARNITTVRARTIRTSHCAEVSIRLPSPRCMYTELLISWTWVPTRFLSRIKC